MAKTMGWMLAGWVLLAAPVPPSVKQKEELTEKDINRMVGKWKAVSVVRKDGRGGRPDPFLTRSSTLTVTADRIIWDLGVRVRKFGYTIVDPTANPKQMDLFVQEDADAGTLFPAIYQIDDDRLEICYDAAGRRAKRPTLFAVERGQMMLMVFERVKDQ